MTSAAPLLRIAGLCVDIATPAGSLPVLRDVDLAVDKGKTLGVVGESGSGKSMTALAIMRLLPGPAARIRGGQILLEGGDLLRLDERAMRRLRGGSVSIVFQDPMTSLNPLFTVGEQIGETLRWHENVSRKAAAARAVEMLRSVGIPEPERRVQAYPHQLSGGMRQRVTIAIALACGPKLLIADEPTTALDVSVQVQIFALLQEIQARTGTAIILISHDFGVVGRMAHRVAVMYGGRKVEDAPTERILRNPRHPYTQALLRCVPSLHGAVPQSLPEIPGSVPGLAELGAGCPFAPRCPSAMPRCAAEMPPTIETEPGHALACWLAVDGQGAAAGAPA